MREKRNEAAGRLVASLATLFSVSAVVYIAKTSFEVGGLPPVVFQGPLAAAVTWATFCAGVYAAHKKED